MTDHLDIAELLKIELAGKKVAMGRYDGILWKIRSGYMLVLAGTLGFFVTEGHALLLNAKILFIIHWFSLVAWMVDINYRRRQLRVVKAYNELISAALNNLSHSESGQTIDEELFYISGERLKFGSHNEDIALIQSMNPSILIYLGTAAVATLLWFAGV
jgi:Flp pilus assembly protein TadB